MKMYACPCHEDMEEWKSRYTVHIVDRIKTLMGEFDEIPENSVVTYTFSLGYETLEMHTLGQGSSTYRGTYHPDGVCETGDGIGICSYCGATCF
jgi:hypothetical protein